MIGRRSLLILAVRLLASFLGFIGLFLITNLLGSEVYGTIVYVISLLAAFNAVADLGFNSAHIKKVSEGQDLRDCFSTFVVIKLVLTLLLVVVTLGSIFVYSYLLGGNLSQEDMDLVVLFTLYYALYNLSTIVSITYYGTLEVAKTQVVALADVAVRIPLIAMVAFAGGGAVSLAFTYVASAIAVTVVAFVFLLRDRIRWTRPTLYRPYFRFALPLALVVIVGTVTASIDKIMLGFFDSSNAVAYYSASQSFLSVVLLVGTSVATITYPSFSSWHSKGNVQEIRKVTLQAERYLTMFGLPICALLVLFPTEIAVALFGPDFVEAGGPMRWLGVATFLSLVNAVHASQINAVNRPDLNAKLTFLQFMVFIPLLFILIPNSLFGIPMLGMSYLGASLAYLITTVVIFAVTRWMVLKLTGTSSNPRLLVQLVAAAVTAVALFLVEGYLPIDDWMVLLLYVFMALGLFSGLLFLLRELRMDDVRYLMDVLNPAKMMRYSVDEVRSKPK